MSCLQYAIWMFYVINDVTLYDHTIILKQFDLPCELLLQDLLMLLAHCNLLSDCMFDQLLCRTEKIQQVGWLVDLVALPEKIIDLDNQIDMQIFYTWVKIEWVKCKWEKGKMISLDLMPHTSICQSDHGSLRL